VPCDARSTGWRGETRYARWRELRSDNRRESDGRRALRAPPVLLRFSAAAAHRPHLCRRRCGGRRHTTIAPRRFSARTPVTLLERRVPGRRVAPPGRAERMAAWAAHGDVCGAEQRRLGVGARSALRTI